MVTPSQQSLVDYAREAKSANTKRAYLADWRDFEEFCRQHGQPTLPAPPDCVALYLRHSAETRQLKLSTVGRRLAAISERHRESGFNSPAGEWIVRNTLCRLRRELGSPARGKAPLLTSDLQRIVAVIPDTLAGCRDKATS